MKKWSDAGRVRRQTVDLAMCGLRCMDGWTGADGMDDVRTCGLMADCAGPPVLHNMVAPPRSRVS
jgi:hypothetical protein